MMLHFYAFWSLLCTIIALFYLFRLVGERAQIHHFDAENEVGHGIMATGMTLMLAPAGLLTSDLLHWNIILFAVTTLWWTFRLLAHKPLLALLPGKNGGHSTFQSDAIHVFMHVGMCYMFLLMSSMTFSMTQPAMDINYIFCFYFALPCTPSHEWLDGLDVSQDDLHDHKDDLSVILTSLVNISQSTEKFEGNTQGKDDCGTDTQLYHGLRKVVCSYIKTFNGKSGAN